MGENYDEKRTVKIEEMGISYILFDWHGIFDYTVGEGGIYYIDPKYIDKFLEQGF